MISVRFVFWGEVFGVRLLSCFGILGGTRRGGFGNPLTFFSIFYELSESFRVDVIF